MEQRLISTSDGVLKGQGRDGSERSDRLCRKLGAFRKDGVVQLGKLCFIPDPKKGGGDNQGHRRAERYDGELPPEVESNGQAANHVEQRDDDKGHVCTEKFLELARICGQLCGESTDRVVVGIEKGYRLGEDVAEVLSAVVMGDMLFAVSVSVKAGMREEHEEAATARLALTNASVEDDHPNAK